MKSTFLLLCVIGIFLWNAITAFAWFPLAAGPNMWREYMSPPRYQLDESPENYACETYAIVGCLEAIYNQVAGLNSTTKVRLLLDDSHYQPPFGTIQDITTYPNYNDVEYNYRCLQSVEPGDLEAWLLYTPVCVQIDNFDSNDYADWEPEYGPIDWVEGVDDFHWMVCIGYGTYNGKTFYRFFNQWDEGWADDGFIDIYDNDDIEDWYMSGRFPVIYEINGISEGSHTVNQTYISISCVPHIFPAFFPNTVQLQYSTSISDAIYIVGDFKLSSNDNTLNIQDDSIVKFETSQITPNEGGYSTRNEIIVTGGTLNIHDDVTFRSIAASPSPGDWGHIQVTNNGYLAIGNNVTIRDAQIGLNIESGTSYIDFPVYDGSTARKCIITNCLDWGMLLTSNPQDITNIEFSGNGTSESHGSLCVMGSSANPTINHVTITGSTVYGIYLTNYANMDLSNSKFDSSIQRHMIYLYSPSTTLSLENKYNKFLYSGDGTYHAIWNPSSDSLYAKNNYWNGVTDQSKLFENPAWVCWTPAAGLNDVTSAGAYKIAIPLVQTNLFQEAEELEKSGNLGAARDLYRQILTSSGNIHDQSRAIKSLIRNYEIDYAVSDMSECVLVIAEELSTASGWYKELLEYLQCDLIVAGAKKDFRLSVLPSDQRSALYRDLISKAVQQFVSKSSDYNGSSMQVEMLCRAAVLSGDYLQDKSTAKKYAEMVAAINPGQPTLLVAFQAAGIEYDPWQYNDLYMSKESIDRQYQSKVTNAVDISVTPNPFNPSTMISFSLDTPSWVKLSVYSINGQKVTDLADKMLGVGRHSFVFDGSTFASGVFFYRFESSFGTRTGKMLLVK